MDSVSFMTALPGFLHPLLLLSRTIGNIITDRTFVGTDRKRTMETLKAVKRINIKKYIGYICACLSKFVKCN